MLKSFTTFKKEKIDSIAIGGFDGVHRGHQVLIEKLTQNGALLIVHRGGVGLTPLDARCLYHDRDCIMIELSKIKEMSAEAFVLFLQEEFPALKKIIVGYDFRFGKDRKGDSTLLQKLFSGQVEVVEEVFYDGTSVHAKKIKSLLLEGKVSSANALLGRDYSIQGVVVQGQGIGKEALYPTLNIKTENFFLPKEGVYTTRARIQGIMYPAVTFIGKRLSTDEAFSIETYLLEEDFSKEVDNVEIFFVDFIRENRKFSDLGDLKRQITQDIEVAKLKLL